MSDILSYPAQTKFELSPDLASVLLGQCLSDNIPPQQRRTFFTLLSNSGIQMGAYSVVVEALNACLPSYPIDSFPTASYLKGSFDNPEFSNFIDSVIHYTPLSLTEYTDILARTFETSENYRIASVLTEARMLSIKSGRSAALDFVASKSKSPISTSVDSVASYDIEKSYHTKESSVGPMFYLEQLDSVVGGIPLGRLTKLFINNTSYIL
ncbi:hypothetical protein AGMMS49991_07870 [Spirochaetia bacterium]|nr:hypothetical protein AGMMS49991_07870 [Spirochaetia bacterium]